MKVFTLWHDSDESYAGKRLHANDMGIGQRALINVRSAGGNGPCRFAGSRAGRLVLVLGLKERYRYKNSE